MVIEVDLALKRDLHASLARKGLTLKDWFVENAAEYLANENQLPLDLHVPAHAASSGGRR